MSPEMSATRWRWARVIMAARKKRGLSRTQLAHQMSLSHSMIRSIEAGYRAPSPEVLEKLVVYLGIDPWALFHDQEAIK